MSGCANCGGGGRRGHRLGCKESVPELRARAEKAEAEAAREFEAGNDWCERALAAEAEKRDVLLRSADAINDQGRELARLRDGIQALADEAERTSMVWVHLSALRALLSPTPEDKP